MNSATIPSNPIPMAHEASVLPPSKPRLSAVIVAASDYRAIARTVRHIREQTIREQIELVLVVPARDTFGIPEGELDGFAGVQWIELGAIDNVDRAAGPGMQRANAPVVVAVEDHAFPDSDWAEILVQTHNQDYAAVGGAMENGNPGGWFSWANLLLNYGKWGSDTRGGHSTDELPGHNIAYKRELLRPFNANSQNWLGRTSTLHSELQATGHTLYFEPRAKLQHINPSKPLVTMTIRFWSGRLYGATRRKNGNWELWRRLLYVLGSPLIPFMQYPAIARNARQCGRNRELLRCMPAMISCLLAAAFGEAWGYLFGEGGVSEKLAGMEFERFRQLRSGDFVDLPDLPRA